MERSYATEIVTREADPWVQWMHHDGKARERQDKDFQNMIDLRSITKDYQKNRSDLSTSTRKPIPR
jgi:hypothetical protein